MRASDAEYQPADALRSQLAAAVERRGILLRRMRNELGIDTQNWHFW